MLCFILVGSLVSITANLRASLVLDAVDSLISSGFYPIQKGVTALQKSAANAFEAVGSAAALRQENKELRETTESLFSTGVRARELEKHCNHR